MSSRDSGNMVLAVYPSVRGFAFVLFEGADSPFDWGVRKIKVEGRNTKTLDEIKKIVDRYRPEVLVIEATGGKGGRRPSRIRKLYRMLVQFARAEYLDLYRCPRSTVKACFAPLGASTKREIAKVIALRIPAFAPYVPPKRRAWMREDRWLALFDAAALGLTFYARSSKGMDLGSLL